MASDLKSGNSLANYDIEFNAECQCESVYNCTGNAKYSGKYWYIACGSGKNPVAARYYGNRCESVSNSDISTCCNQTIIDNINREFDETNDMSQCDNKQFDWLLWGIIGGSILCTIITIVLCYCLLSSKVRKKRSTNSNEESKPSLGQTPSLQNDADFIQNSISGMIKDTREYDPYHYKAFKDHKPSIGDGEFDDISPCFKISKNDKKNYIKWSYKNVYKWIINLDDGKYKKKYKSIKDELKRRQVNGKTLKYLNKQTLYDIGIIGILDQDRIHNYIQELIKSNDIEGIN